MQYQVTEEQWGHVTSVILSGHCTWWCLIQCLIVDISQYVSILNDCIMTILVNIKFNFQFFSFFALLMQWLSRHAG